MENTSSPPGSETPSDGTLPVRIGGYRILRRLATGGTSEVLLGKSETTGGPEGTVVLKILLQEFREDEKFERMFATEAAAYSRLSHPAVVKLYDFFSDGDQLVMVLEYVDGMPLHKLRALLKRGKFLDDAAAMFLAWRVFGALSAAHTARDPQTGAASPVIHRDVNPSNVLVPWDGQAKIADFGIAKVTGLDNDKTAAGFIKGTYGYMAPEQVRGENVTERADVYAASLVLWELLAGRKAIVRGGASDHDVLRAMAEPAFPSLSALRPELPLEVLDAVERGLERDPDKRTITAEELAAALHVSCNLADGRQRLVDALGGVRPHDDLAVTVLRAPRAAVEASADATIPNLPALADDSQDLPALRAPARTPPPPTATPSATPPPPSLKATISMGAPQTQVPRPAPTPPPPAPAKLKVSAPTLMGISPSRPPGAITPSPMITEKPATPVPTVVLQATPRPASVAPSAKSAPPPPPAPHPLAATLPIGTRPPPPPQPTPPPSVTPASEPVTVRTPPPPPPAVSAPPLHVPTQAASFVVSPFASTQSAQARPAAPAPPPPPPPPAPMPPQSPAAWTGAAPVWGPPPQPPQALSTPPLQPPRELQPTSPSAHRAQLPYSDAPPASHGAGRLVAAVGGVLALLVAILVIVWMRQTPSAYVPPAEPSSPKASATPPPSVIAPPPATAPSPAPSVTAAAPPPSPLPAAPATAPTAAAASPAAPSGTMGTITVGPSQSGHRIFVDTHIVGESPGTFSIRCGWRSVMVGSQGWRHNVNVPCGGDIVIH